MDEIERSAMRRQLREETEADIAARRQRHQFRVAQFKKDQEHRQRSQLAARSAPLDLLAIGDSWFDYPLNDYGVPWPNQAIPAQLELIGIPSPLILNEGLHGQAMTSIMGVANQEKYVGDITDPNNWVSGKPDAILVSGGGDDIAGDQFVIYLDHDSSSVDVDRFKGVLDSVEASYKALFMFRDRYAPGTPIIGHCYDYAIPDGSAVVFAGPWLKPSLDFALDNYTQGLAIVKQAIDLFYDTLHALEGDAKNNFTVVDTRGVLTRDHSQPLGWANEIHPYTAGFVALAQKFLGILSGKFPGRI
jgi:hypothetical protein